MAQETIRPAAYVFDPGTGSFIGMYRTLAFPPEWRQPILDLWQHGWRRPDPDKQIPIRRLNAAIRALAPDLVSVADRATLDGTKPWLYTNSEYPKSVIGTLILNWLYTMQPDIEKFGHLRDAYQRLDVSSLEWDMHAVDLTEQAITAGGTADPAAHLFRLLPEVLAARIEAQQPQYEYADTEVTFHRVATDRGAELMSWPPTKDRQEEDEAGRPAHYSAVIKITLQTVPFSPVPRIHLSTGIRRWVRGSFYLPVGRGVTTYLRADGPWLAGTAQSPRFAAAKLVWDWKERKPVWAVDGPQGVMSRLVHQFPDPEELTEEAEAWLHGRDGVAAAVTHHTTMRAHAVKTGLMPTERQRLTQWAGQALLPEFHPVEALVKSGRKPKPDRVTKKLPSLPRKKDGREPDPEQVARIVERRGEDSRSNATLRRELLARAIGGRPLVCHMLYQTDAVRDELVSAAERNLDLRSYRVDAGSDDVRVWDTPEVSVRMHMLRLGELGAPLGDDAALRREGAHERAVEERRTAVCELLKEAPDLSQVVFVELEGKKAFKPRTDPKGAIRLGCADAGRVSQFITPLRRASAQATTDDDEAGGGSLKHRADSAWADGLRQIGMALVPQHSLPVGAIPERVNQLAFWIVRRNVGEASKNRQFTPIAVLIRPGQDCILGRTPTMSAWAPYPDLLKGLTGDIRGQDLKSAEQQAAETARFLRQVLYNLRSEPTVVLTHAQNMRSSWEWLLNPQLIPDKIRLSAGLTQDLALHGKTLTLIRIRDSDNNETPQWWSPKENEFAGFATGLWRESGADDNCRVFYATAEKPVTHKDMLRDDTKLTPHANIHSGELVINSDRNAWNPTLLEIAVVGKPPADDAEAWATYVHHQRFPDDYLAGLKFPLVLHLAELAHEYALPFADRAQELTVADEDIDGEPGDSLTAGDLDDMD